MKRFIDESGSLIPRPPVMPTISGAEFTTVNEEDREKVFNQAMSILKTSPNFDRFAIIAE
jgi:hypothetical protein